MRIGDGWRRASHIGESGQSLVEGCCALAVVVLFFAVAIPGLVGRWNHFRCLHSLFERTHSVLVGGGSGAGDFSLDLAEDDTWVVGKSRCGATLEEVKLRKI